MGNFGIWEILLVLLVVLLVFGPKRLPEMGRSLGRGMREFKDSVTGNDTDEPAEDGVTLATAAEVAPAGASTGSDTAATSSEGAAVPVEPDEGAPAPDPVPAAGQGPGQA
jgi:sec-independent protein translocase protein TatA